jgi:L-ascorbate metabolism protein UlaG (beta-lactamase superfamily)
MEISWVGHSCFIIKGREATVVTDPCHPDLGYPLNELRADVVTISHLHFGHSYIEGIADNPKQIKGPGEYEIRGVFITGIASFHDAERGEIRGDNTIYIIEIDGINLCHLGDLGHQLTSAMVEEIGTIDVLFLPVGGVSTIDIHTAVETVKQLTPHIVIPMHYKTPALQKNLKPVDEFLKEMGIQELASTPRLSISQLSMPTSMQVVVLNYT